VSDIKTPKLPPTPHISPAQAEIVTLPLTGAAWLEGPAGSGKTTAGAARLTAMLDRGVPAASVLVLTPQRTLGAPYTEALRRPSVPAGGEATVLTLGGLARRMVELFWPLAAGPAGFAHPDRPPVFLTLETAQYYMARIVRPLIVERGYFDSVVIDRNRLYSQVLDNLNKAAVVGFPHDEIGPRLKAAWLGESAQGRIYDEAQECAARFRAFCLAQNLLDFSLQYEAFARNLWPLPVCRDYLTSRYHHLIADNVEEDTPAAHDILAEWLPELTSALLIYDQDAGYRRFLGADPASAYRLAAGCERRILFSRSYVNSPDLASLGEATAAVLGFTPEAGQDVDARPAKGGKPAAALVYEAEEPPRFHPEMLDWVAAEIDRLLHEEGTPPREIAVLAPFLSGALRFSLAQKLEARGVAVRSHRPSRALREEPAALCLLTLAALAHPQWGIRPTRGEAAQALMLAIDGMDLVRAHLLAEIAYRPVEGRPVLGPFAALEMDAQERITFLLGGRYDTLRLWLAREAERTPGRRRGKRPAPGGAPLDHFLSRLFGELLSQPGYGFHDSYDAAEITAVLIESARKFRQVMQGGPQEDGKPLGQEYVEMVRDGVVAAQYVSSWMRQPEDAVLLAPAYTFLMANRPVDYQFWLEVGSSGWWERLYQPLTQPYVLSRGWETGRQWTDRDEYAARTATLARLALGLTRRCRKRVYLGLSELDEHGYEPRGSLLQALQAVLRGAG
jgi:hypothetical protein